MVKTCNSNSKLVTVTKTLNSAVKVILDSQQNVLALQSDIHLDVLQHNQHCK